MNLKFWGMSANSWWQNASWNLSWKIYGLEQMDKIFYSTFFSIKGSKGMHPYKPLTCSLGSGMLVQAGLVQRMSLQLKEWRTVMENQNSWLSIALSVSGLFCVYIPRRKCSDLCFSPGLLFGYSAFVLHSFPSLKIINYWDLLKGKHLGQA